MNAKKDKKYRTYVNGEACVDQIFHRGVPWVNKGVKKRK